MIMQRSQNTRIPYQPLSTGNSSHPIVRVSRFGGLWNGGMEWWSSAIVEWWNSGMVELPCDEKIEHQ